MKLPTKEVLDTIENTTKVGARVARDLADWWAEFPVWRGNNSRKWGVIREGDFIVYEEEFRHSRRGETGDVEIFTVDFDSSSTHIPFTKITGIDYRDYWVDSTGAKGEILGGGLNKNYLKFRVTPQYCMWLWPRGCHSKLVIYGTDEEQKKN